MTSQLRALVLSGGGARGAYQVGVLKALAEIAPTTRYPFDIITGVSVGALNAAVLASHPDDFKRGVDELCAIWSNLHCEQVYRTGHGTVLSTVMKWARALSFGWVGAQPPRSLLDNAPLLDLIKQHVDFASINNIGENHGLKALAITSASYQSGRAISFYASDREIKPWERARRIGQHAQITPEHVMASSALPIIFPSVMVDNTYFGDGALRENAPLSAAIHLGAQRVLTIAARDGAPGALPDTDDTYPSVGELAGQMLDILFNDNAQTDLESLSRTNSLLLRLPPEERAQTGLMVIDHLGISPSSDIRQIAGDNIAELPGSVRTVLNVMGAMQAPWVLPSYLMFEPGYSNALIDLGFHDAMVQRAALSSFM